MPEGESILGCLYFCLRVIIEDVVAKLLDRIAFVGSVSTSVRLVRTSGKLAEVPLGDAVKIVTLTPAKLLGIAERKGQIAPGKDGDLVVVDADINVS